MIEFNVELAVMMLQPTGLWFFFMMYGEDQSGLLMKWARERFTY